MRVTTAFNKLLALDGASVTGVSFTPDGVVVEIRARRRRPVCPCGWLGRAIYDRSRRRWRHLDLGASKLFVEAEIRRVDCGACGRVRTEDVPWARPAARHTRDFEDVVAWLVQRCDKTSVAALMRTSWATVARIVARVVVDHLDHSRLEGLRRIGVDEVSWRKGHRYLTVVADHDRAGAVVWAGEGHDHSVVEQFYDELGAGGCAQLEAVSLDMGKAYKKATDNKASHARQCVDPFHVIKLANEAIDKARRWAWNLERRRPGPPPRSGRPPAGTPPTSRQRARWVKHTRWALVKDPANLNAGQLDVLHELQRSRSVLYRGWQLKEGLRDLYRLDDPSDATNHLNWWLAWACRSRIPAFVELQKRIVFHRAAIDAALDSGLSNALVESTNTKIRLLTRIAYGFHRPEPLIALAMLALGAHPPTLPGRN